MISRTTNPQDRYNREAFAAEIPSLPGHIEFLFWDDMNSEELAERLKGLDDSSAVFINGMISDPGGRDMMYRGSTEWISGHSPVPVYSLWEGYLGHGIVGGKIVSGRMHGRMAAELALRILEKGYEAPLP